MAFTLDSTKYYLFPFFCKMTGFAISAKMASVGEINKFNSPLGFEMIKIENRWDVSFICYFFNFIILCSSWFIFLSPPFFFSSSEGKVNRFTLQKSASSILQSLWGSLSIVINFGRFMDPCKSYKKSVLGSTDDDYFLLFFPFICNGWVGIFP